MRAVAESVSEERVFFLNLSLSLFLIFTKSALHDEGYAWIPETRDFIKNSGKYSENPNFFIFHKSSPF